MLKASYGGIGSIIRYEPKLKRTVIVEPYENMPAAEVGLKAGDILLEIDGKDLTGNTDVSKILRGQVGTSFQLKVERPGEAKPLDFTIVRKNIQLPFIPYYSKLDNNIGYINLSTFSGNPSKEFKKAFLDLKKQGITSLVIDLRNNGGGLLEEAVEIANYFLPRGKTIVTTKGKIKQASNTYKTLREPLDTDIPIAVLVNSGTASASEILAGALQDYDRAVIVGNRTFGKGLVQVPRTLPYGGTMKVTTSKYYIPSGRCVQAIDYKHRNPDGSVGRIPDSLTTVFHTAVGREVRDGGGVTPDVGLAVLRIIRIKTPTPHGRPHKVTAQTQNQFEHTGIKTMITIIRAISVFHPPGQARSLVIQKDTPILYRRFSRRITSTRHRKILPGHHRHIRPVVPRRNTNLLRKLINPINRSNT